MSIGRHGILLCTLLASNGAINEFGGLPFPLAVATPATLQLR